MGALVARGVAVNLRLRRELLIFWSDNGGYAYLPKQTNPKGYTEIPATSNLPYRSGKASLYDGGTREPGIVVACGAPVPPDQ